MEKVLNIIKKKKVNVSCLFICGTVEEYNDLILMNEILSKVLTKEEFDLLREKLK